MFSKYRWNSHVNSSYRRSQTEKLSKLYSSCPHKDSAKIDGQLGTFQDLKQLVGIGISQNKKNELVKLFNWESTAIEELKKLKAAGGRDSLIDKKYHCVCYLFEAASALAIAPAKNISSNPTCEWQLRYYG